LHSSYGRENKINATDFGCREHPVAQTREDLNQWQQMQNGFKRVTNIKFMYSF